jgi:DNA repair protein RecO (recombination protein O)
MTRTPSYNALILRARPSGESNRELTLITAEEGLLRAMVFGGPKSRLRAHTTPYHQGTVWLYRDPVKDFLKVTDFDVQSWRPGIREDYDRTMAAAAVAETILASHGGGTERTLALELASGTLDALENGNGEGCRRLVLQFLWNWADILGCRPDLRRCVSCGKPFPETDTTAWYSRREGSCSCSACSGLDEDNRELAQAALSAEFLPVGPGARRWLFTAENLKPGRLDRVSMDRISQGEARALCTAILSAALGKRLACWTW